MGFFDSKQKTTSQSEAAQFVAPWLTQATNRYGALETPEVFGGDWQAGLDPMLSGAWNNMYQNPAGQGFMQQAGQAGNLGMDAMGAGMGMMANMQQQPGGPFQYNQGVFDQTMGNLMPALQGSYDAATRDNNRQLNWNTLPGLDMGLTGSGQEGSTKHGQASALATGMTMDRNADIGASMYQNAVNQAQGAAMGAGQMSLGANMDMLGQYGNYAGMGLDSMNNAFNMNQGMLSNQLTAGQGMQGYNQQGIDYDRAQWDAQQTNPWTYGAQQMANLGQIGSAFGTQTNTSKTSPGLGNIGLQLGAAYLGGGGMGGGGMGGGNGLFNKMSDWYNSTFNDVGAINQLPMIPRTS